MTDQKFSVFLLEPVSELLRTKAAATAASNLGLPEDKVIKLLSRPPGFITRASGHDSTERIANILLEAGCKVEVRPWSKSPPAQAVAATASSDPRASSDVSDESRQSSTSRDLSEPEVVREDTVSEDKPSLDRDESDSPALNRTMGVMTASKRRFPISFKMLLAALLPLLLFAAVTLYMIYSSVNELSTRLLSEVGDNVALSLASDFSSYLDEQGVAINSEEAIFYFTGKLKDIEKSLHETVGVHYTNAEGVRINGNWEPAITQNANFDSFTSGFSDLAKQTLSISNFGQSEDERRASLLERTKLVEGRLQDSTNSEQTGNFYVVASPLKDKLGTIQVVISEGNVIATALGVIRPILFVAVVALLVSILIVAILAFAIANNIRRLASAAEQIALGELEQPVKVRGNDETRDLAESFETMRKSLKAAIERLSRRES